MSDDTSIGLDTSKGVQNVEALIRALDALDMKVMSLRNGRTTGIDELNSHLQNLGNIGTQSVAAAAKASQDLLNQLKTLERQWADGSARLKAAAKADQAEIAKAVSGYSVAINELKPKLLESMVSLKMALVKAMEKDGSLKMPMSVSLALDTGLINKEAAKAVRAATAATTNEFTKFKPKIVVEPEPVLLMQRMQEFGSKVQAMLKGITAGGAYSNVNTGKQTLVANSMVDMLFPSKAEFEADVLRRAEQLAQVAGRASAMLKGITAGGTYSNVNTGKQTLVANSMVDMLFPSKAEFEADVLRRAEQLAQVAGRAASMLKGITAGGTYSRLSTGKQTLVANSMVDMLFPPKAEFEAATAARVKQLEAITTAAQAQIRMAMRNPVGSYQEYDAIGQSMGKLVPHAGVLSTAMQKLGFDMNTAHSAARGLSSGFGGLWLTWGQMVPLLAGAAISFGFKEVVSQGAKVQDIFTQIRVLGEASVEQVARLNEQMLSLARSGPFGPLEIAEAMKTLTLAGLKANEVLEATPVVLNFAMAGTTSIKSAADALTTVGTAFGISAKNYSYISDVIVVAAKESKSSVESMNEAFKTASVVNTQYGVTLKDTAIGLALLANAGIQGSAAGTALRNMYADLAGRTQAVKKALDDLGVKTLDITTGKMREQAEVMKDLMNALSTKLPTVQTDYIQRIFSERGAKEAQALFRAMRAEIEKESGFTIEEIARMGDKAQKITETVYQNIARKIDAAAGVSVIAAVEQKLTPLNQMKAVLSSLQATLVEVFNSLQPYILQLSTKLQGMFSSPGFKEGLRDMVVGFGTLATLLVDNVRLITNAVASYYMFRGAIAATSAVLVAYETYTKAAAVGTGLLNIAMKANPAAILINAFVAVAGAVFLYKTNTDAAKKSTDAINTINLEGFLDQLSKEVDQITKVNRARKEGISLRELEAKLALAEYSKPTKDMEELAKKITDTEAKLTRMKDDKDNAVNQAARGVVEGKLSGYKTLLSGLQSHQKNQLLAAEMFLQVIREDGKQKEKAALEEQANNNRLTAGLGTAPLQVKAAALSQQYSIVKKAAEDEIKVVKNQYDTEMALAKAYHDAALISDSAFASQQVSAAQKAREAISKITADEMVKNYEVFTKLSGGLKKDQQAQALQEYVAKQQEAANAGREALDNLAKATVKDYSAIDKAVGDSLRNYDAFIAKKRANVSAEEELAKRRAEAEKAGPEELARVEAVMKVEADFASHTEALTKALAEAESAYLSAFNQYNSEQTDTNFANVKRLSSELEALRAKIEQLKVDLTGIADNAGDAAALKVRVKLDIDSLKENAKKYEQLAQDISDKMLDSLMNGAKNWFQDFRAWLAKQVIKVALQPVLGALGTGVAALLNPTGAAASQAGYGSPLFSSVAGNAAGGFLSETFGGLFSGASTALSQFSTAAVASTQSLLGLSGTTAQIQTVFAQAALEGVGGSTAAISIGSAMPFVAAAIAAISILKGLDDSGTPHTGGAASYDTTGYRNVTAESLGFEQTVVSTDIVDQMKTLSSSIVTILNGLGSLTGRTGFSVSTAFADDSSGDGSWGGLRIERLGESLINWMDSQTSRWAPKSFADGQKGYTEYLNAVAADTRKVLQEMDLPDWANGMLERLGDTPTMEELTAVVSTIGQMESVIQTLGQTVRDFSGLSSDAILEIISASGGLDKLGANLTSFYDNFYSETEKLAIKTENFTKSIQTLVSSGALDATADSLLKFASEPTRANFRALIEAQDLTTTSGRQTYAALLALSGQMADLTTTTEATTSAVASTIKTLAELKDQFEGVAQTLLSDAEYRAFQVSRIQASLGSIGLNISADDITRITRGQILAALGEALSAGTEQGNIAAQTIMNLVGAISEVSVAFEEGAASARSYSEILQERAGLESTLYGLIGDSSVLRQRELAELDPANRGLQQHIYAIQDAQQAVEDLTQAQSDQNSVINTLRSDVEKWLALRNRANSLSSNISTALGGTDTSEAALWARLGTGTLDEQLATAEELFSLIKAKNQAETDAANKAISNAEKLVDLGKSLRDYVQSLKTGSTSPYTPSEKLGQAQADYYATLAKAKAGDADAQAKLQSIADTYLQLYREYDPGSYRAIFDSVTTELDALGATWQSLGQQQLDAANATVKAVETTNTLSAEQVAKLTTLKAAVDGMASAADAGYAEANAKLAAAEARLAVISADLTAANATLAAAKAEAAEYLKNLPSLVDTTVTTNSILTALPANIAAALAPLLNATSGLSSGSPATTTSTTATISPLTAAARAQVIRDYANSLPQDESGAMQLYNAARQYSVPMTEINAAMGWAAGTMQAWATAHNLPTFASGGYHSGGLRLVGERGPEIEGTGAARYWSNDFLKSLMGRDDGYNQVIAQTLVRVLEELRTLQAVVYHSGRENVEATKENTQAIDESKTEASRTRVQVYELKRQASLT